MSSTTVPATEISVTPIGVDVGVKNLVTVAAAGGGLEDALLRDGDAVRRELSSLADSTQALRYAPGQSSAAEVQLFAARWHRLRAILYDVATDVVEYAQQYAAPVLVLEDLEPDCEPLWTHRTDKKPGNWLMPQVQQAIVRRAEQWCVPTAFVDARFTSQECHECGAIGELGNDTVRCTASDCHVGSACRDRSAAVSIATRWTH